MDVFVSVCKGMKAPKEQYSWLQHLFKVVSDDVYKPSFYNDKILEELCFSILCVIMERTGDRVPVDHTVLSVSSLKAYEEAKYFTGKFGEKSEPLSKSNQISAFKALEERPVILIGFLTDVPTSDKPIFPETGMLYVEDNKSTVMCQLCDECGAEKSLLNNLVILPKWNFIDIKIPILIYESDRKRSGPTRLKYIEVVEKMICVEWRKTSVIPKALSLGKISKMKIISDKHRINVVGGLKTLSSTHMMYKQKPYFFARLYSAETELATSIAFWGYKFAPWYNLMLFGETYVITGLKKTTMNKGKPSERVLLAATEKHSDIFVVDSETYAAEQDTIAFDKGSEGLKRKLDEMECKSEINLVKRFKPTPEPVPKKYIKTKSGVYSSTALVSYQGVVTAILDPGSGLYEIDNRFRLYTIYLICNNFGCGIRVGACVTLQNIHFCQLDEKVLGFVCCNSTTIKITKHSMLDSPFQYYVAGASYIGHLFHRLALLDYIKAHELCEILTKKFRPSLSGADVIGPRQTWDSVGPTILSHVIDLGTINTPSRDMFDEFFSDPHRCIVSTPSRRVTIPTPLTLKDVLGLVDAQGNEQQRSGGCQYEWSSKEITQKELPEDLVLLGWISNKNENGALHFCDVTSSILCLIVESEVSQAVHKCDAGCFVKRHDTNGQILSHTDQVKPNCPLPKTYFLGAILKLSSFKIIVESFSGQEILNNAGDSTIKRPPLRKVYLVFSPRDAVVIGKVPGFGTPVVEKRKVVDTAAPKDTKEIETGCRFVFLVKHKELDAVVHSKTDRLTACVHGYVVGELESTLGSPSDQEGPMGSYDAKGECKGSDPMSLGGKDGCKGDRGSHIVNEGKTLRQVAKECRTVKKQELVLQFTNNSGCLDFLHQGRLYYVIERHPVNNACHVKYVLEKRIGFLPMDTNLRIEEIDDQARSRDYYENCALLVEPFVKVNSVRSYLSRWENRTSKDNLTHSNFLVSFRGIIVTRETVVGNDNQFSLPPAPKGQIHIPGYGCISASHALSLSLGFCHLGNQKVVLIVQDTLTADTVRIYLDVSTRRYPVGLLPGAVVTFRHLQHHVSKKGNIYLSFEACSGIKVEALPSSVKEPSELPKAATRNVPPSPDSQIESRQIMDYFILESRGRITCTLAHILGRITAVQKVLIKWTCSRCGRLSTNCYCHVSRSDDYEWIFFAEARCLVDDGTGEAMLFIDGADLVKHMLFVGDSAWVEIQNMAKKHGQVLYQRYAHWKDRKAFGDSKVECALSSMATSPKLFRNIKILCKQFKMSSNQGFETRQIRVEGKEHTTRIAPKIVLKVLKIHEVDYKHELKSLITSMTDGIKKT